MGCCEGKNASENIINYQIKTIVNTTKPSKKIYEEKIYTIDSIKGKKPDIPKTREVKIPTLEISNDIIKSKKHLILTIIEASYITEGTILHINPGGLEGSERMAKDGLIFFGSKNDEYINDFYLPEEDCTGSREFEIKYDINKDCYRIKNIYGNGLFVKIFKPILLRNNSIFSFSNSHIIVNISMDTSYEQGTETDNITSIISLRVIYGINLNQEYHFDSNKNNKITIGRLVANGVDIAFSEESTSRMQCTIYYENNNWYIIDCDGIKESLNGTWYLADEYMDVYENMIFRSGTTSFRANLYYPQ